MKVFMVYFILLYCTCETNESFLWFLKKYFIFVYVYFILLYCTLRQFVWIKITLHVETLRQELTFYVTYNSNVTFYSNVWIKITLHVKT